MYHQLALLESVLTGELFRDPSRLGKYDPESRRIGGDWPANAWTMIGSVRLAHLRKCCENVIKTQVPGAFIECGVWRGGAAIMMKAVIEQYSQLRSVICADSFCGLPKPTLPQDATFSMSEDDLKYLAVPVDEVRENFRRFGLLDSGVVFLRGWFKDTLPKLNEPLAILRVDGDLYESTMDALTGCYRLLSPGGYVIIDDYGAMLECRRAVHDFRAQEGCTEAIQQIDQAGVYWVKS